MIAEKLEHQLDWLETLAERNNGDLAVMVNAVVERMRGEVARLRELEERGVLVMPGPARPSEEMSHERA